MSLVVAAPARRPATGLAAQPRLPDGTPRPRLPGWVAPGLVVALAGLLRLVGLGAMRDNSFYDAAVRSMGGSWHAFATGAIDPVATVSVDKPPVDLWLQVASTRVLGFGSVGLHLPEALGGTLAVLLLFRPAAGRCSAARPRWPARSRSRVLPIAVITSRSDTMDSLMAALVIARGRARRACGAGRSAALLVGAGAVLGLAFEVKLFEALVAAPALVLLWWLGSSLPRRARAAALGGAGAAFVVVALAWLVALPLLAGAQRPWAFGSTNGSAWNATFVYDGIDRVTGVRRAAARPVPSRRRRRRPPPDPAAAAARPPPRPAAAQPGRARAAADRRAATAPPPPAGPRRPRPRERASRPAGGAEPVAAVHRRPITSARASASSSGWRCWRSRPRGSRAPAAACGDSPAPVRGRS